jgi:hypothetical protein
MDTPISERTATMTKRMIQRFFPSLSFISSSQLVNDFLFAPEAVKLFLVGGHSITIHED